jgi:hypothetical protein
MRPTLSRTSEAACGRQELKYRLGKFALIQHQGNAHAKQCPGPGVLPK